MLMWSKIQGNVFQDFSENKVISEGMKYSWIETLVEELLFTWDGELEQVIYDTSGTRINMFKSKEE